MKTRLFRFLDIVFVISWPLLLGAVAIVQPYVWVSRCLLLVLVGLVVQSRIGVARRNPGVLGLQFILFMTVLVAGALWPVKAMDSRIELGSQVLMLGDLAQSRSMELYPGVDPGAIIRLERTDPSRKQLSKAIRTQTEFGASRTIGVCGRGASLLNGGFGMGLMRVYLFDSQQEQQSLDSADVPRFAHHLDEAGRPVASFCVTPSSNRIRAVLRGKQVIELDLLGEDLALGFRVVAVECPRSDLSCLLLIGADEASGALRTLRIDLDPKHWEERRLPVREDRIHTGRKWPHDAAVLTANPAVVWFLESQSGDVWGWEWAGDEMRCVVQAAEHPQIKDCRFLYSMWEEAGMGDGILELDVARLPYSLHNPMGIASFHDRNEDGWFDHVYIQDD